MTPTLNGRIQSKFFLLLIIAPIWNAILVLFLDGPYGTVLWNTVQVLVWISVIGILWEILWHALQQGRWEKDWPIMFGLLQFIPEGILVFFVVSASFLGLTTAGGVGTGNFLWSYITTVFVTWLWINGPHRIFFIKWRFEGGRFV